MFAAFGIAYSYGAFLRGAARRLRRRAGARRRCSSRSRRCCTSGSASLSGFAADRWGPRRVLLAGAAAFGLGLVATSMAGSLPVALAAYGLGVGIGVACAYVPMVALVGGWFERRRTLALGVAVAGIGLGTLIVPPATAALIEAAGWRDAYLVHGHRRRGRAGGLRAAGRAGAAGPGGHRDARWRRRRATTATAGSTCRRCSSPWPCSCRSCTCRPTRRSAAWTRSRRPALIGAIGVASVAGRLALGALAGGAGLLRVFQGCYAAMGLSFALWAVAGGSLRGDARLRRRARASATAASWRSPRRWWPPASAWPTSARCSACCTRARGSARRSGRRWRARCRRRRLRAGDRRIAAGRARLVRRDPARAAAGLGQLRARDVLRRTRPWATSLPSSRVMTHAHSWPVRRWCTRTARTPSSPSAWTARSRCDGAPDGERAVVGDRGGGADACTRSRSRTRRCRRARRPGGHLGDPGAGRYSPGTMTRSRSTHPLRDHRHCHLGLSPHPRASGHDWSLRDRRGGDRTWCDPKGPPPCPPSPPSARLLLRSTPARHDHGATRSRRPAAATCSCARWRCCAAAAAGSSRSTSTRPTATGPAASRSASTRRRAPSTGSRRGWRALVDVVEVRSSQ